MKIGFDVDGVLANFNEAFVRTFRTVTGKNLFEPQDTVNPPIWDYHVLRGYTKEEIGRVVEEIDKSLTFWADLNPLEGAEAVARRNWQDHDVYFITHRTLGQDIKWQTETWLTFEVHTSPTVLLSGEKGMCAKALDLDVYIDDKWENVVNVALHSPTTRTYLYSRAYNSLPHMQDSFYPGMIRRVLSVEGMLVAEGL
jgi:5'(3')-deoxyribonucleotidase